MKKGVAIIAFSSLALISLGACSKKEDLSEFHSSKISTGLNDKKSTAKSSDLAGGSGSKSSSKKETKEINENVSTAKKAPVYSEEKVWIPKFLILIR